MDYEAPRCKKCGSTNRLNNACLECKMQVEICNNCAYSDALYDIKKCRECTKVIDMARKDSTYEIDGRQLDKYNNALDKYSTTRQELIEAREIIKGLEAKIEEQAKYLRQATIESIKDKQRIIVLENKRGVRK